MKEQPNVKMSVEMGRQFMLMDLPWFDTDMRESSSKLCQPFKGSPASEKIKYVLCCHATTAFLKQSQAGASADTTLELLWFTYGFAPCQIIIGERVYVALVSPRGVCWIDNPPRNGVEPDGVHYPMVFEQLLRIRNNLCQMWRDEQQLR